MPTAFDPYYTWLGIRPEEQPPNHYRLLALQAFEDNLDTIEHAADQRMAHLRTLQSGKHAVACQKLLNEVSAAKLCLMNPQKKAVYDGLLRARLDPLPSGGQTTVAAAIPVRPVAANVAQAIPTGPSASDPMAQFGEGAALSTRTRSAGARRRKNAGPAVAMVVLSLMVIAGVLIWAATQGRTSGNGGKGDVAQGSDDKNRSIPQKPEMPSGTPAAKEVPSPKAKAKPINVFKTPDPAPAEKEKPTLDPETEPVNAEPPLTGKDPMGMEPAKQPPPAAKKTPAPSAAEQDAVVQELEKVYGLSQLKTAAEKLKVAGQLYELAKKSEQNPAEQFTLLRKATELAVEGNDALGVSQAIDAMAAVFEIDALAAKERAMVRIAEKGTGAERLKWLVEQARIVLDQAQAERRYDLAMKLATAVKTACQSSRDYRKETNERFLAVQEVYKQWEAVQQAKAAIAKDPADAGANFVLGQWHCFQEDDWEGGLPYLAKGSDAELKAVAALETAPPTTPEQQLAVANAWWDLAAKADGDRKTALMRRAGQWYTETSGKLTSTIAAAEAEKRLAQINEYLTPADESPAAKTGAKTGDPAAKPGEKKELSPRDVVRLFGLQKPKWSIDGDAVVGQLGPITDPTNNPSLKPRRGTSLEFSFKIQSRWYQVIHVYIDGQRYSCSRGHNRGMATVITVAGADQRARWWEQVASTTDWCALRATFKEGKLTFYYNDEEQWSGMIPEVKGGKHTFSVGFASNLATVKIKDVVLDID